MSYALAFYGHLFGVLAALLLSITLLAHVVALMLDPERWQPRDRSYWYSRLQQTRFILMLSRNGINSTSYLVNRTSGEVRKDLRNCEHCDHKVECDRSLVEGDGRAALEVCPNSSVIERLMHQSPAI
jgi:hypothetical protein